MEAHSFRTGDTRIPNSTQIPSYQLKKRRSTKERRDRIILIKTNYLKNGRSFLPNAPRLPKEHCLWKVSSLRPFVLLVRATSRRRKVCSIGWTILIDRTKGLGEKPCPSAISSNTNLTRTNQESRPGLRGERPAINRLMMMIMISVNKMCLKFKHQTSLTQTRNSGMHRSGISSECYRKQLPLPSSFQRPSLDF